MDESQSGLSVENGCTVKYQKKVKYPVQKFKVGSTKINKSNIQVSD